MQLIIIFLALIFSGFFSGSETAFISANLTRLEVLVRQKIRGARITYNYLSHPENYLITILVGNNITVVIFSSLVAVTVKELLPESLIVIFSSILLLLFGEIIPKTISHEAANRWVIVLAVLMQPVHWVLFPISFIFKKSTEFLTRLFEAEKREDLGLFSKQDLMMFFRQGLHQGLIEREKGTVINKILCLSEQRIRGIMIPRVEIVAVEKNTSIEEIKKIFRETGLSRILVYENELDYIVGKIHVKDLFNNPHSVTDILREVMIVPETKTLYDMLLAFKKSKTGIAAIISEHGGLAGLVSVEDIVEEIFGDIVDEHDPAAILYQRLNDGSFLLSGRLEINFVNEFLKLKLPKGDYETIAGLIMTYLGRIPHKNETFTINKWRFHVVDATRKTIKWVKLESTTHQS